MTNTLPQTLSSNVLTRALRDRHFLTGMAVGGVVALVLSNKDVQNALFRGFARVAMAAKSGIEEVKERFHDAEAEVAMEGEDEEFEDDDTGEAEGKPA